MCRMMFVTADLGNFKPFLLDRLMLLGNAENQRDGWGVAGIETVCKDAGEWRTQKSEWLKKVNRESSMIGHTRAASPGTEMGAREAHPYLFPKWVAAHNGFLDGPKPKSLSKTDPQTDSFAAFYRLDTEFNGDLRAESIERWLATFGYYSKFVLLFLENNGAVTVVRGDEQREFYVAPMSGGWVGHTSYSALKSSLLWCAQFNIVSEDAPIYAIPPYTLVRFGYNQDKFERVPLNYELIPTEGAQTLPWNI